MGESIAGSHASEMPGLDLAEQRAWQSFLDSALRLYAAMNRILGDAHKLTLLDVRLLDLLDKSPTGAARMGDVADALASLPSRVTRQIGRLETQGLVRRTASPDDGRGVLAAITDDGRATIRLAMDTYSEAVRANFLEHLTRPQIVAIGDSCQRISSAMQADAGPDHTRCDR